MAPALPEGDPAPADGLLPPEAVRRSGQRDLSLYVHVPFCTVRCGYCDFNTYTAVDFGDGVSQASYASIAAAELELAASVLARSGAAPRPLRTVFFGGGTPTALPVEDLAMLLRRAEDLFGLVPGAEVTTEANPDSVDARSLQLLAEAGFTRVSFGMQSAVPHVLATLDRTHTPARVPRVLEQARAAGLGTSLDLIYGAPGESVEDWRESVEAAIAMGPDHISAYALVIEGGTKMAAQLRRGELPDVDPDEQAAKYELADALLSAAGYEWYEISNWARPRAPEGRDHRSAHNLAYWRNQDWWGIGPGAHSHMDGLRWWNLKHPVPYAHSLAQGRSPAAGRERLSAQQQELERIMLGSRIATGLPLSDLPDARPGVLAQLAAEELIEGRALVQGQVVLTLRGRLLADTVLHRLMG